jgi:hypothetical protein
MVSFELRSPSEGKSVSAGQMIQFEIWAFAAGVHEGLSMFAIDFRQDPSNPETFNLPPAATPASMQGFDRPAGFTNPSREIGGGSSYGGTPAGALGSKNRIQIGGMQNTFGVPGPCIGPLGDVCLGQDVNVDLGIGQAPSGALVATLTFPAPSTPGSYVFAIAEPIAFVITASRPPPQASVTARAKTSLAVSSIGFAVQ